MVRLTVLAATNLGLSLDDDEARGIFDEINQILEENESDVPGRDPSCQLRLGLEGGVGSYSVGDINSKEKLQAALGAAGDIKVVSLISWCVMGTTFVQKIYDSFGGCAVADKTALVVRITDTNQVFRTDAEASLWLHERGHVRHLGHGDGPTPWDIMFGNDTGHRRYVSAHVCEHLLP